ncbi:MAG: peptidase [Pimelobacter sp.]|nr:peptidase [Pimelobacter sp.]
MRFNPKSRLDRSRVSDAGRGRSAGRSRGRSASSGGMPIPGGAVGGGGIAGLVIAVVVIFLVSQAGDDVPGMGTDSGYDAGAFTDTGRYDGCRTGEDANASADCARVAVENSLTDFWADELGSRFRPEEAIVTFSGGIDTACGGASSDTGPFYCSADETIYLDDAFFDDVLAGALDGPRGAFVEPYVLAHEYGHHISYLIGTLGKVTGEKGPQSSGVRLELQADCFAGVWTKHATETEDAEGNVLLLELSQADIDTALAAAKAVGDDYIQRQSGRRVDEEVWTHGSSEQRRTWFMTGYDQGSMEACDTFGADRV